MAALSGQCKIFGATLIGESSITTLNTAIDVYLTNGVDGIEDGSKISSDTSVSNSESAIIQVSSVCVGGERAGATPLANEAKVFRTIFHKDAIPARVIALQAEIDDWLDNGINGGSRIDCQLSLEPAGNGAVAAVAIVSVVYIDTDAYAASAISIEDTAGVFTGENVETVTNELYDKIQDYENVVTPALDELFKYQMLGYGDPGDGNAIPVDVSGSYAITTAAAETNPLAIPTFEGQRIQINCDVYAVGDRVITAASAINVGGNTIMTFGAADDMILLQAVQVAGVLAWRIIVNIGVALS